MTAVQVTEKSINNQLSVQGTLKPKRESEIAASGYAVVMETFVQPGDQVDIGDPLLRLKPVAWQNDDLIEVAEMYFKQSFTANLQEGMVLYADTAGSIVSCAAVGDALYPAQTAVAIADLFNVGIVIEVPEIYAKGLKTGQTATAVPISGEGSYNGYLTQIAASVKEKTNLLSQSTDRIVECTLTLMDVNDGLRPGMTMDVTICTDTVKRAVIVPYKAVRQDETEEFVYVVSDTGIEKRWIETGYQLSSGIQVKRGLYAGEWVLTDEELPESLSSGIMVVAG